MAAGYLTRTLGERARGRDWYETRLLPRLSPVALYGVVGPLIEVPALVALVYAALAARRRYYPTPHPATPIEGAHR